MNGKPKTLTGYLDELKTPAEVFEDGMDRMFARLDAHIARQEAQRKREEARK